MGRRFGPLKNFSLLWSSGIKIAESCCQCHGQSCEIKWLPQLLTPGSFYFEILWPLVILLGLGLGGQFISGVKIFRDTGSKESRGWSADGWRSCHINANSLFDWIRFFQSSYSLEELRALLFASWLYCKPSSRLRLHKKFSYRWQTERRLCTPGCAVKSCSLVNDRDFWLVFSTFTYPSPTWCPQWGDPSGCWVLSKNSNGWATILWRSHDDRLSRLGTVHQRDRQTRRQTHSRAY